jgi:hypothetical protein
MKEKFHISTVASVIFKLNLSKYGRSGVKDILLFIFRNKINLDYQMEKGLEAGSSYLLEQFPDFSNSEIQKSVEELKDTLEKTRREESRKIVIKEWVSKLTSGHYGIKFKKHLKVAQIPKDTQVGDLRKGTKGVFGHEIKDPIEEMVEVLYPSNDG